jgi:hypothetical protein
MRMKIAERIHLFRRVGEVCNEAGEESEVDGDIWQWLSLAF